MEIIGRLTRDAEVRTVNSSKVVNFSIAMNKSYRNKQGERVQITDYVDCAYWRTEKVAQYLTKGALVQLTGWMTPRAWTDREGKAHAVLNFRTDIIEFHGGGTKSQTPQDGKEQDPITWEMPPKTDKPVKAGKPEIDDDLPF